MHLTFLPYAEKKGATLISSAKVDRVHLNGEKAKSVSGHFISSQKRTSSYYFKLHTRKAVIVAASVIQTPGILKRSGIKNKHLGAHFQAHPGGSLLGIFDEPVTMWFGATQGYIEKK